MSKMLNRKCGTHWTDEQKQIDSLKAQLAASTQIRNDLLTENEEKNIFALKVEIASLNQQLSAKQAEIDELQTELGTEKADVQWWKQQVAKLREENEQLEKDGFEVVGLEWQTGRVPKDWWYWTKVPSNGQVEIRWLQRSWWDGAYSAIKEISWAGPLEPPTDRSQP